MPIHYHDSQTEVRLGDHVEIRFTGAIAAEGSGSGVTGRIQPHGLAVGIAVVLVVVSGVNSIASVV